MSSVLSAQDGETFYSRNPATGEVEREHAGHGGADVEQRLARSAQAFSSYRALDVRRRAGLVAAAADILDARREDLARLAVREMGKTIVAARAEVEKCAWACRYYAEHGPAFLAPRPAATDADDAYVAYQPLGPVLAVMPWNFPYWQVFRFAAPSLVAGNTVVLKHAANVPGCAQAIEDVFAQAGFAPGVFQTLLINAEQVHHVLADERVRAATLTGSEAAGRAVAETAGAHLKKTVLELGGSDPFIVMPSADLDDAVEKAVEARTLNNGQSCIAAKRFIVHRTVYTAFRDALAGRLDGLAVGLPMDEATHVGPLATEDIRAEVVDQVERSVAAGARRVQGAQAVSGPGYFFTPGVLEALPQTAPAFTEEVFGPVALLFEAAGLDHALSIANDHRLGLGSAIFTRERAEAERAIEELEAGATFVNQIVASDPRLPFGGVKASGYGRELAREGGVEFVNVKSVSITGLDGHGLDSHLHPQRRRFAGGHPAGERRAPGVRRAG